VFFLLQARGQYAKVNAHLTRAHKYGFSTNIVRMEELLSSQDIALCGRMQNLSHCLKF